MRDDTDMNEEATENLGIKAMYYNNLVDRYFTKYYIDKNTEKEQFIFLHTNGVIMCGLGENHYLVKSGIKIKEIKDLNKCQKVSGKRKHGAHILSENEYILQFIIDRKDLGLLYPGMKEDGDDAVFSFSPKAKGKLIEVNSEIFKTNDVVQKSPEKFGFLCFILLSDPKAVDVFRQKLERSERNEKMEKLEK